MRPLEARNEALSGQTAEASAKHQDLTRRRRQTRQETREANRAWQQNRLRIRELGQQLANNVNPTQKLRDKHANLIAKQREQLDLDQANESNANLLSRLGMQHDAMSNIKAGRLLFMPTGNSTTASGLPLPHVTLTRQDGDQHRFLQADRDSYTGAKAYYYEVNSADKKEAIAGGGDNLKELRHTYSDRSSALRATRAEGQRVQRGTATLSYTLAKGRSELMPDQTYSLTGIKAEIAAYIWLGGNLRHSFTPDSYTTSLELESKLPDGEALAEGAA